jgi:phosphate transport system substrate-binding protein
LEQCSVFAAAACSFSAHAQIVKIDGSSTVFPITEAVAEEFQKSKKNTIKVTVGISGTGGDSRNSAGARPTFPALRVRS